MDASFNLLLGACILCLAKTNGVWCKDCARDLFRPETNRCPVCANYVTNSHICGNCLDKQPVYNRTRVLCSYQYPSDHLISKLKFDKKPELAYVFAEQFVSDLENPANLPDILIPVPLHPKRQSERGFNQSAIFAIALAKRLGLQVDPSLFVRERHTKPQSSLSFKNRKKNVKGAFKLIKALQYKHVAIVDDVITTGATVRELAKPLKSAGADNIEIWAIAKTGY